jgi:hypothetical protein
MTQEHKGNSAQMSTAESEQQEHAEQQCTGVGMSWDELCGGRKDNGSTSALA